MHSIKSLVGNPYIILFIFLFFKVSSGFTQSRIIDMHIHSYSNNDFGEREPASDYYGTKGSRDAESHRIATFTAFKKFNIVKAVVSGNPESVENWIAKDS